MRARFYYVALVCLLSVPLIAGLPQMLHAQALALNNAMQSEISQQQSEKIQQLEPVISQLMDQYNVSILYEKKNLNKVHVTVDLDMEQPLEGNLQKLLEETDLTFEKIDNQTYVILDRNEQQPAMRKVTK